MNTPASVWIEADGGSRGNPGPAAYGAVLKDAATGETIAERGETIGVATNNVAEYSGLIAGLELYREHTPDAALEVRMDSRLVVEQMSGNWKIKHPDMKMARRRGTAGLTDRLSSARRATSSRACLAARTLAAICSSMTSRWGAAKSIAVRM